LDKAEEMKNIKDIEEINNLVDGFFSFLFGESESENILKEIEYSFFSERTKKALVEVQNLWENKKIDETLRQIEKSVKSIFFESLNSIGFDDFMIFNDSVGNLKNSAGDRYEILKRFVYEIYLRLPMEAKGKVYKKLREIDNPDKKMVRDKEIALGVILLFMLAFSLAFGIGKNSFTGFNILSIEEEGISIERIPEITIHQNEGFEYFINVNGPEGSLTFEEESQIADISNDGWLKIFPIEETGEYAIFFQVRDSRSNLAKGEIIVNVVK